MLAPIVLFAFNRPHHTTQTLAALAANDLASESELFVYCDGARSEKDVENVLAVREVVRSARGFATVHVIERDTNWGLARSVIGGVSDVIKAKGRVIVLEDDMQTAPSFLRYMNEGLALYSDETRVISICAYKPRFAREMPDTFFLPGAHCWGWATWARGWTLFEPDARKLLDTILARDLVYDFDAEGSEPLTVLLKRSALGDPAVDSWALRWMGSAIVHGKLTLYPGQSLLVNTGFDGSGTHKTKTQALATILAEHPIRPSQIPVEVRRDAMAELRKVLIAWHCENSRRLRLFFTVTERLPASIRRALYLWKTRRLLGSMGGA